MNKEEWEAKFKEHLKDKLDASTNGIIESCLNGVEYDYENDDPVECADDEFDALCDV